MERVQKLIANSGSCSRRKAEELITKGLVKVNGKPVKLGDSASETDNITINGQPLRHQNKRYILLNKPFGYVTSMEDPHETKLVTELVKIKERVFPVGRLDKWTGGMLLFTNDGDFANRITHPSFEIDKTYYVKIDSVFDRKDFQKLRNGLMIEDQMTSEAKVKHLSKNEIELTIHEGRNRIVRKMLESLGYYVKVLIRIKIGQLELGQLKPGYFRNLTKEEMDKLFLK
jgi:23S rRNA pseudouridine2605 synthase